MELTNTEMIKLIRTLAPEQIAKELLSVQPMGHINYIALMEELEHYEWLCPCYGALFNKEKIDNDSSQEEASP